MLTCLFVSNKVDDTSSSFTQVTNLLKTSLSFFFYLSSDSGLLILLHESDKGFALLYSYWLNQKVEGTHLEAVGDDLVRLCATHHHDWDFSESRVLLHSAKHFKAIHFGHVEVQEHQVEVIVLIVESIHRLLSIFDGYSFVIAHGQEIKQSQPLKVFVLGNKNIINFFLHFVE